MPKPQFWVQASALAKKNAKLKLRNIGGLLLELLVPTAVMIGMWGIRLALKVSVTKASLPSSYDPVSSLEELYLSNLCPLDSLPYNCDFDGENKNSKECGPNITSCQLAYIAVAPHDPTDTGSVLAAQQYLNWTSTNLHFPGLESPLFKFFDSEQEFKDYIRSTKYSLDSDLLVYNAAVIFNAGAPDYDFTIRLNKTRGDTLNPQTKVPAINNAVKTNSDDPLSSDGVTMPPYLESYRDSGALALQDTVHSFIGTETCIQKGVCAQNETVHVHILGTADFPNGQEKSDGFWTQIGIYFALLMILALLYPIANVIKSLVGEKETKVREGMLMMALRSDVLWATWIFHFLCLFVPLAVIMMLVGSKLFAYSDLEYIFLYFFVFFLASIAYAILVSVIFDRSRTATVVGTLVFFMGYFIYIGLSTNPTNTKSQLLLACLHPASAFTYGVLAFQEYEDTKQGININTWDTSETNPITFRDTILMQCVNTLYLLVLAWYLSQVMPSEFGANKSWFFIFQPSYWMSCIEGAIQTSQTIIPKKVPKEENAIEMVNMDDQAPVEDVPEAFKQQVINNHCVDIQGIRKEFKTNNGVKVAVDNLSLTIYSGQITALLGHNGAGKSTLLSMLTGLFPPTSGTAIIEGFNIMEDLDSARLSLGMCPQHDVLLDDLTVEEHLLMFAEIKGSSPEQARAEVDKMVVSVGLVEKRHDKSKFLSGGQKRKLSVGIAFIGGSRVVVLDEPTSGMDPYSRRFTWNVIRQHREGRVIILTTHFMDEADLLGDRIAIVGDGKLLCCGSSLYLKKMYGVGYNMTIEKEDTTTFDQTKFMTAVHGIIPDAKLLTNVGTEVTVELPFSSSQLFENLFISFDDRLHDLGIHSYGMSVTTLEEVFLKVASGSAGFKTKEKLMNDRKKSIDQGEGVHADKPLQIANDKDVDNAENGRIKKKSVVVEFEKYDHEKDAFILSLTQFIALIEKRYLIFSGDSKAWVMQYAMPVLFVLLGGVIMLTNVISIPQPSLKLSVSSYNKGVSPEHLPLPYADGSFFCADGVCSSVSGQSDIMSYLIDKDEYPLKPVTDATFIRNMSEYIYSSRNDYEASLYGAFSTAEISTTPSNRGISYVVHGNYTAVHAGPLFNTLMAETYIRSIDPTISVTARLHPFPDTKFEEKQNSNFNLSNLILFILIAIPFSAASFAGYTVYEKEVKAKDQQMISGVSIPIYWLSNWIWDMFTYQLTAWLLIIIIVSFPNTDQLSKGAGLGATILLFVLLAPGLTSFTYLQCFFLTKSTAAQIVVLFTTFVFGLILTIVGTVLRLIPSTADIYVNHLRVLFCFLPPFAIGEGLLNLAVIDYLSFAELGGSKQYHPFDWKISGLNIMMLVVVGAGYFILTVFIDFLLARGVIQQYITSMTVQIPEDHTERDEDVVAEDIRVSSGQATQDSSILLSDVKKIYGTGKYAVKGVSLGIPIGECFGLLGVNGAGKTSLLSILSGQNTPTSGSITLGGQELFSNLQSCRQNIGYCPQFDALFDLLSARQHLTLYAKMKGIKPKDIAKEVDAKLTEMGLTEYADRNSSGYSGGTKRKLSVAMAMLGEPSLIFLDEPSTGMDPMARRFMWDVISDIVTEREKCCLILTTHSMEECEALCSRVGIMVGGVMRCLGSCMRLRNRYGLGFQIELLLEFPDAALVVAKSEEIAAAAGVAVQEDSVISASQLQAVMDSVGASSLFPRIAPDGTGADLRAALDMHNSLSLKQLSSWILLENRIEALLGYLENTFPGYVLREIQGSKVRVEVPFLMSDGTHRKLSTMFGAMEREKANLFVREYSIAQTSLEQIFNFFASQQLEEDQNIIPTIK
jgi:ATP-binding cassette, subfamily A (ABC1), member 3